LLKIIKIFILHKGNTNVGGDIMFLRRKRNLMMDMNVDMHMKSMVKVAMAGVVIYQAAKFAINQLMDE
jgi:hypothetical protein